MKELIEIQNELNCPKNQRNNFGKYNYRSCEDILEAVKPLLKSKDLIMVLSDEAKEIAGVSFIETTCTIKDGKDVIETKGQAGIEKNGGMSLPQAFGSAASYSGKRALGNMFLIDDTKDADSSNTHGKATPARKATPMEKKATKEPVKTPEKPKKKQKLSHKDGEKFHKAVEWVESDSGSIEKLQDLYDVDKATLKAIQDFIK